MNTHTLQQGTAPLLISTPHDGTDLPDSLRARMTPAALRLPDTDWHVSRLYAFARELGASLLVPRWSRYVVDLNRPADGAALYPGKFETGPVPVATFAGEPIYRDGQAPGADEVAQRIDAYWRPYHAAIAAELARLRAAHGRAVLWEGHTIRSRVPLFFDGTLPDLNLGTSDGNSCSPALQGRIEDRLRAQDRYTFVVNGRFKGGYITRHYADPAHGIDAVQLEVAQHRYMDEDTFAFDEPRALELSAAIRPLLRACL
jgi:N-formylglutamate deformylase